MVQGSESEEDWLISIVHLLANAYGWAPQVVLCEVRMSEVLAYQRMLRAAKLDHYLALTRIVLNPHTKDPTQLQKELFSELSDVLRYTGGMRNDFEPDHSGIARFKAKLAGASRGKFIAK